MDDMSEVWNSERHTLPHVGIGAWPKIRIFINPVRTAPTETYILLSFQQMCALNGTALLEKVKWQKHNLQWNIFLLIELLGLQPRRDTYRGHKMICGKTYHPVYVFFCFLKEEDR